MNLIVHLVYLFQPIGDIIISKQMKAVKHVKFGRPVSRTSVHSRSLIMTVYALVWILSISYFCVTTSPTLGYINKKEIAEKDLYVSLRCRQQMK